MAESTLFALSRSAARRRCSRTSGEVCAAGIAAASSARIAGVLRNMPALIPPHRMERAQARRRNSERQTRAKLDDAQVAVVTRGTGNLARRRISQHAGAAVADIGVGIRVVFVVQRVVSVAANVQANAFPVKQEGLAQTDIDVGEART